MANKKERKIKISNYNFLRIEDAQYHRLLIGKSGENEYRSFCFDVSKWLEKYPSGYITAVFKRPDGQTYPVVVTPNKNVVTWTVTATELAVAGKGELELQIHSGEVIGKSASIVTISDVALEPTVVPTEPQLNWIEDVVYQTSQAASTAYIAVANANEAAAKAYEAAESIKDIESGTLVTHDWNGTVLTITSASGTSSADLKGEKGDKGDIGTQGPQGEKGDKGDAGADGANGNDGVSATHSWNGTTLTITSASGTSSADLKGEKGEKGDIGTQGDKGEKGDKGDAGADGANGNDGVSATHSWNGTILTITSASGTSSADLKGEKGEKGDKGDRGQKGKDAYEYAIYGGFFGSESTFSEKLADLANTEWQATRIMGDSISSSIFPGQEISFTSKSKYVNGYSITNGVTYFVEWNGKVYESVAQEVDGEVYLGDYNLLSSSTVTNYPFLILHYGGDGGMIFKATSNAETVTCGIGIGYDTVPNKLPEEFLPDGVITEEDIPTKLPNPNALKFTGAVNATYDGTSAVTVNIPSGSGGGGDGTGTSVFNVVFTVSDDLKTATADKTIEEVSEAYQSGASIVGTVMVMGTPMLKLQLTALTSVQGMTLATFGGVTLNMLRTLDPAMIIILMTGYGIQLYLTEPVTEDNISDVVSESLPKFGTIYYDHDILGNTFASVTCTSTGHIMIPSKTSTLTNDSGFITSDNCIINSSTEGSTKKFRLTVDDSGTISAVEV